MDATEKIATFKEVTGLADTQQCMDILEAHEWNLDAAVVTILAATSGERDEMAQIEKREGREGRGPAAGPSSHLRSRERPLRSSSSISPWQETHGNGGRSPPSAQGTNQRGGFPPPPPPPRRPSNFLKLNLVWNALKLPFWMLSRSFKLLKEAVGLGFWLIGGTLSTPFNTVRSVISYLAGGRQPNRRFLSAQAENSLFIQEFEEEYGNIHPTFVNLPFRDAVKSATEQFKFLLVCLHSPDHVNSRQFCRDTLCTEVVTGFIDQNFVCWGANVRNVEGHRISKSMKATTYPFCAVVTRSANQRMALLHQMEGPVSPDSLISVLQRVIDEHGVVLVSARLEAEERVASRRLREEQDAAYQAALLADQEKERILMEESEKVRVEAEEREMRRKEEEMERLTRVQKLKEKEEALKKHRVAMASKIRGEPQKGPEVTQVVVRLPGGERRERRFHGDDSVECIYDYVDSLGLLQTSDYSLVSNFPRKVYGVEIKTMSLKVAGLHPHASLFVQEHDS